MFDMFSISLTTTTEGSNQQLETATNTAENSGTLPPFYQTAVLTC